MSHPSDRQQLLADLLADAEPSGFRDALRGETLSLAGRRRRIRRLRRLGSTVAVLGLFGAFAWRSRLSDRVVVVPPVANYFSVHTAPIARAMIVHTQALSPNRLIMSVPSVDLLRTTTSTGNYRTINDDELLALLAPRLAALVRVGPRAEKVIFANPNDERGFPVN